MAAVASAREGTQGTGPAAGRDDLVAWAMAPLFEHYGVQLWMPAMALDPARPRNTYVREDKLLPHLPALHLLLTSCAVRARCRTRAGADVKPAVSPGEVTGYLREHEITRASPGRCCLRHVP